MGGPGTGADGFGAYALRELIRDVPLSGEDGTASYITCVDAWNGNLYIGTSAGEVLHYVSLPSDPADESNSPSYIFATKLEPPFTTKQNGDDAGIKQILVLPNVDKACILCNGTLTFYTLPELSPAFGGQIKQSGCTWVGGLDLSSAQVGPDETNSGTVMMICLKQRLRLIRIGKDARKIRDIELGGVRAVQRRGDLACVADGSSYSLLDVVNQRKNELFPISSLAQEDPPPSIPTQAHATPSHARSQSAAAPTTPSRAHERNASMGNIPSGGDRLDETSTYPPRSSSRQETPAPATPLRDASPAQPRESLEQDTRHLDTRSSLPGLQPIVVSPTPYEFLLTTGTRRNEPGVGIFVNMEGDVTRGAVEFSTYPRALVLDSSNNEDATIASDVESPGYILAVVERQLEEGLQECLEVQRWDQEPGETHRIREYIKIGQVIDAMDEQANTQTRTGLRKASSPIELAVPEISRNLTLRRLSVQSAGGQREVDVKREAEEDAFTARFSRVHASVLLFSGSSVSWVTRSPLIAQLEAQLAAAVEERGSGITIKFPEIQGVISRSRLQEAKSELDFLTLTYARQKGAVLLFGSILSETSADVIAPEADRHTTAEALINSALDPRIILSLLPVLRDEIVEGQSGVWCAQGMIATITLLRQQLDNSLEEKSSSQAYRENALGLLKQVLLAWRKKKGFGSVADEAQVSTSVDAALLHTLLLLDHGTTRGPATAGSVRSELNEVVDKGVACFDRAVELFERFERLYLLSRLYQSRKQTSQVLATWKRIMEGAEDAGGELVDGPGDMRRYLSKLRDRTLVSEYGAWLARRNPKLGIEFFADDTNRVKFSPEEAMALLKEHAPDAVKDYLEHLVFDRGQASYGKDLIAYYMDIVLQALGSHSETRELLRSASEAYRALQPPKPTYSHFLQDNPPENSKENDWWQARLRLLQLLGSQEAASNFDVRDLRNRLEPYRAELVPEMIILNGREGKHDEAMHLLTHNLGDYDTAVRYCLLGGASVFPGTALKQETTATETPSHDAQAHLFSLLLHEMFTLPEPTDRLERATELLERFAPWFSFDDVLATVPGDWAIEHISGFLISKLREIVSERNETIILRALAGAQNLRIADGLVEKIEAAGPVFIGGDGDEGVA